MKAAVILAATMEDRTMQAYAVTYNVTLTIEVQADSANEAERLADRELPSHCDVNRADARGQFHRGLGYVSDATVNGLRWPPARRAIQ